MTKAVELQTHPLAYADLGIWDSLAPSAKTLAQILLVVSWQANSVGEKGVEGKVPAETTVIKALTERKPIGLFQRHI